MANVAFKDNEPFAFGSSFVKPSKCSVPWLTPSLTFLRITAEKIASSSPTISPDKAVYIAEHSLEGKRNEHPAGPEYYYTSGGGSVVLTPVVQVQNEATDAWYETFVDAHSGDVVSVKSFMADASVSFARDPVKHGKHLR